MATIYLKVDKDNIATYSIENDVRLVAGNPGAIRYHVTLQFESGSAWTVSDNNPITCRFVWNGGYHDEQITNLNQNFPVPLLINTNSIAIGIYQGEGDSDTIRSSTYVVIPVAGSIRDKGAYAHGSSDEHYTNLAHGYMNAAKEAEEAAKQIVKGFDEHVLSATTTFTVNAASILQSFETAANQKQEEVIVAIAQGTQEKINSVNAAAQEAEEKIGQANTNLSNLSNGITQAQNTFNILNTELTQAGKNFDELVTNMNTLLDEIIAKQNEWIGGQV